MKAEEFRRDGHHIVDWLADYLESVEQRPLFPDVDPAQLDALFDEPLPQHGSEPEAVRRELDEKLFPYLVHVNHPGYFGLMTATPTPAGIFADLIASTVNQNLGTYVIAPSATALERRTLRWLADLVGYGPGAGGNLTSGGALANLIGVKLGRDRTSGNRVQHGGVREPLAVYASEERHVSIDKAADMVGIGREGLRVLPTDAQFRIRLDALEQAIAEDRRRGVRPAVLIGIAGTTNTGAIDPLPELAAIARREGMWFHADAAYGAGVLLLDEKRALLAGLEQADSVTMDPHKWFYAPIDAGAVLVREASQLTESFGLVPPYLTAADDRFQFYVHGFEQSRRFRSLKVWMCFKQYGAQQIGRWIRANIEHAARLAELAAADPEFECVNQPQLSALCLRYRGGDAELHRRVATAIEREGRYWISTTRLHGAPAFRINPVNVHTQERHIEGLFRELRAHCRAEAGRE